MKKKAGIALLLALVFLLGSCASATRYGSTKISEEEYRYWLSCYKYMYMTKFKAELKDLSDTEEGWKQEYKDGKTYNEVFFPAMKQDVLRRVAAAELFFNQQGQDLTKAQQEGILNAIDDMFYYEEDADRDKALSKYGVREKDVRRIAAYEMAYGLLRQKLFSQNGSGVLAPGYTEEVETYYKENVRRVQVIFVSDPEDIRKMNSAISEGVTEHKFLDLMKSYNVFDIIDTREFKDGLYLLDDQNYNETELRNYPEMLELAYSLKVGEAGKKHAEFTVQDKDGKDGTVTGNYYVLRCEPKAGAYMNPEYKQMFMSFSYFCSWEVYLALLDEHVADMKLEENVENLGMWDVPFNQDMNILKIMGMR